MPKPIENSSRYNPAIDGLRTLAVMGVILYHIGIIWIPGGLLGVGVFFTISGFLITGNLIRSWHAHGNLGLSTFWLRRLRRLMPAVILTVFAVWIVTPWLAPENWGDYRFAGLTAIFYVNNWASIFYGDSYFDQFTVAPFDHMWSLSVEEQFYLFWPLILLLILYIARGRRAGVIVSTGFLAIASFIWMGAAYAHGIDATRIYEGTDTRAGGLLAGAMLAIAVAKFQPHIRDAAAHASTPVTVTPCSSPRRTTHTRAANTIGILSIFTIVLLFIYTRGESAFLYYAALPLISIATAGLIYSVLNRRTLLHAIFGLRPFSWLGERSYALYLWHMPLIAFTQPALSVLPLWLYTIIICALSVVLASMSWTLVEDPIRRHGFFGPLIRWIRKKAAMPRFVWAVPLALILAVALIGIPAGIAYDMHEKAAIAAQQKAEQEAKEKAEQERIAAEEATKKAQEDRKIAELAATTTRCHQIVHLGDSTSLAMFTDGGVLTPEDNAQTYYATTGAQTVVNSSFGARATNQGFEDYPSGNQSLQEILAAGVDPDTCFVLALGINDAANMNVEGKDNSAAHIADTMDIIGPNYPVLWITAVVNPNGSPRWYEPRVMNLWNDALYKAQATYPNLWVYPWDKDIQPSWFIEGDGVHYNQQGSSERSHRFAQAVINAWPMTPKGDDAPLLPSPAKPASERIVTGDRPAY